jgi:hypothetical protein
LCCVFFEQMTGEDGISKRAAWKLDIAEVESEETNFEGEISYQIGSFGNVWIIMWVSRA